MDQLEQMEQKPTPQDSVRKLNYSGFTITKKDVGLAWFKARSKLTRTLIIAGFPISLVSSVTFKAVDPVVLYVALIYSVAVGGYRHTRISKFAADNSFGYEKKVAGTSLIAGTIFENQGRNKSSNQILTSDGSTMGLPSFTAFTQNYTVGSGKNKRVVHVAVLKVELAKNVPHFVLDDVDNGKAAGFWGASLGGLPLEKMEKLELEGDFQDHYLLFRDKGANDQIDLLSILTPDFMQWLVELDSVYDIEFLGRTMFIFGKNRSIVDGHTMRDMIAVATRLIPRVKQALEPLYQPTETPQS